MFEKYQYDPAIALALKCESKAFIVEFVRWSVLYKAQKPEQYETHAGRYYTWDTQDTWQKRMPWLGAKTIWRHLKYLRELGLLMSASLSKTNDRTLSYTLDFEMYEQLRTTHIVKMSKCAFRQNDEVHFVKMSNCISSKSPIVLTKTHTKTQTKTLSPHKKCIPFDLDMAKRCLDYNRIKSPNGRFNEVKFAEAIMKMRTKFSESLLKALETSDIEQAIEAMFVWIQQDEFWNKQSPSPPGLLRPSKSDPDLTKLEQVLKQISGRKKSKSERVMDSILKNESEVEPDYNPLRLT